MEKDADLIQACRKTIAYELGVKIELLRMDAFDRRDVENPEPMLAALDEAFDVVYAWMENCLAKTKLPLDATVWLITDNCERGFGVERQAACNLCCHGCYHVVRSSYRECVLDGVAPEFIFDDYESCQKQVSERNARLPTAIGVPATCPARRLYEKEA